MMINIDLMDLADIGNPQKLAEYIIKSNPNLILPIPIEDIAKTVGIINIEYRDNLDFEGALVANEIKSQGIIVCRNSSKPERKRFTIAHELGHFLIPTHSNKFNCATSSISFKNRDTFINKEQEANCFASHILVPPSILKGEVHNIKFLDIDEIVKLKTKFAVSYEAFIRALVNCVNEPMAFIFAESGIIKYFVTSSDFPYLGIYPKQKIPIKLELNHNYEITDSLERDGDYWLSNRPKTKVYEQSLILKNKYSITMLTLD